MSEKKSLLNGQKLSFRKIGIDKLLYCLLAGVALLILSIPTSSSRQKENLQTEDSVQNLMEDTLEITEDTYEVLLENRLEEVLSYVEGVGKIKVMVTLKASGEKVILRESPYTKNTVTEEDKNGGSRNTVDLSQTDTVIFLEKNGEKIPYIIQETAPEIEGILVIIQGGDSETVKKELNAAITALFDLPSHKIKICKMAD